MNAFTLPNAGRPQVTVTLPGSANQIPALTAMKEWVQFVVRTPNAPLFAPGLPNVPTTLQLLNGRNHFIFARCVDCHGGPAWTRSLKTFIPPPSIGELFTERTPAPVTGNPVGTQYLNAFLRDIDSFNLGVPGQGNPLGLNVGAEEKAAAVVTGGSLQPAQDGLGKDYNGDGKGIGFNTPSLLGIHNLPPYLHNGAAESIAGVLNHVQHRSAVGFDPFNPTRLAELTAFLESIDAMSDPFAALVVRKEGNEAVLSFGNIPGAQYTIQGSPNLIAGPWTTVQTFTGTGRRIEHRAPIIPGQEEFFYRLRESP